jgi:hypothetical protein
MIEIVTTKKTVEIVGEAKIVEIQTTKKTVEIVRPLVFNGGNVETFETVSANLRAYACATIFENGKVARKVFSLGGGKTITKTFNWTGSRITSIVLSGDTPTGIALTKTFTYAGANVSVGYS